MGEGGDCPLPIHILSVSPHPPPPARAQACWDMEFSRRWAARGVPHPGLQLPIDSAHALGIVGFVVRPGPGGSLPRRRWGRGGGGMGNLHAQKAGLPVFETEGCGVCGGPASG